MKNAGLTIGMCAIGLGLASIGFNLNGNQATATPAAPAAFHAGPGEPTIVWYGLEDTTYNSVTRVHALYRAWSDGTVEMRIVTRNADSAYTWTCSSDLGDTCTSDWIVISSPNEGLNAAADVNFDERVDGSDLAQVLAAWGDAPRNDYPPSDCPLGLIP